MHLFNTAASLIVACSAIVARAEWSSDHDTNATIWKDIASISSRSPPASRITKRQSTWSPPSNLVTPLKQVWDHEMSTYSNPLGFKNYGYDQIMANKGYVRYILALPPKTPHPNPTDTSFVTQLYQLLRSMGLLCYSDRSPTHQDRAGPPSPARQMDALPL